MIQNIILVIGVVVLLDAMLDLLEDMMNGR